MVEIFVLFDEIRENFRKLSAGCKEKSGFVIEGEKSMIFLG
jgi:hypothetical protein